MNGPERMTEQAREGFFGADVARRLNEDPSLHFRRASGWRCDGCGAAVSRLLDGCRCDHRLCLGCVELDGCRACDRRVEPPPNDVLDFGRCFPCHGSGYRTERQHCSLCEGTGRRPAY